MKVLIFTNSERLSLNFSVPNYKRSCRTKLFKFIESNKNRLHDFDTELYSLLNAIDQSMPLFLWERQDLFFALIDEKEEIIGCLVLGFLTNKSGNPYYEIKSVGIERNEQGKGLSKTLIDLLFKFSAKNGIKKIKQSPYTLKGNARLKKYFNKVSKKYPEIKFVDTNKKSYFN